MNLKPLGDRVIVRPKEGEKTLPSGIVRRPGSSETHS